MSLSDMVLVLHCSTLCDHCFFFCFLFSSFLGFALYNIQAFHSRWFCYFLLYKKKEAKCVLHYFLGFEIKVGQFIFT